MTYKFRAWDNDENNMIYFGLHSTDCGHHIREEKSIDDMPTMQFVGLKDKNNTDIYEADIVKVQFPDYDNSNDEMVDSIGIVKYNNSPFEVGFIVEHISGLNHWYDEMGIGFAWNELEVIGNIYENRAFNKCGELIGQRANLVSEWFSMTKDANRVFQEVKE